MLLGGDNMTNEEKESLNYHGTNISYAGLEGLVEYVEELLEKEYQYGYDQGSADGWQGY